MLAAIGETFDCGLAENGKDTLEPVSDDLVTGVAINVRPNFYRLNVWTRFSGAEHKARLIGAGRYLKKAILGHELNVSLQGGFSTDFEFMSHKDAERKGKNKNVECYKV